MKASLRTRAPLTGIGAVIVAVVCAAALPGCSRSPARPAPAAPSPSPTPALSTPASPSPIPAESTPTPGTARPSASRTAPTGESSLVAGRYQPVWPFGSPAQVRAWQNEFRRSNRQAWHLDAAQTALAFTRNHLGFRDLKLITSRKVSGIHARIGVGLRPEPGTVPSTAAIIHLVRYGTGPLAPWEVVGTDDTTFSLTVPRYGASVTSPVTVGGRITGVDESIRVQVFGRASSQPVGEYCCLPAGGENRYWSAKVSFRVPAAGGQVLTVVASTGGHVADVERFAITAVRPRG
ncbi:hypothetical protein AB0K60_15355 [Thermopolyspora sp. NPDC052614]|uniref:hypothetical protein n=1 Tax=Thermopolyspora sp. NPDC052614 TaxID=3155682 RepID=UPI003420ED0D